MLISLQKMHSDDQRDHQHLDQRKLRPERPIKSMRLSKVGHPRAVPLKREIAVEQIDDGEIVNHMYSTMKREDQHAGAIIRTSCPLIFGA